MSDGITDGAKVKYVRKNYYIGASDRKLCEDAISIQDASNLAAVVNTLKDMIVAVRERNDDWKTASTHPAVRLTIMKVMDLAGIMCEYSLYAIMYDECKTVVANDSVHNE